MKRSLVLVPILLLVLLNACGGGGSQEITNEMWAAMAATLTATNMPPTFTPSPTLPPNGLFIVDSLNAINSEYAGTRILGNGGGVEDTWLVTSLDQLEDTIGADFTILDVQFPPAPNGISVVFQVHAKCECATNGPCCTPEHMFVLTLRKMYMAIIQFQQQNYMSQGRVPPTIEELQVVCYDHQRPIATMVAPWPAVQSFLNRQISGYQLGLVVDRR